MTTTPRGWRASLLLIAAAAGLGGLVGQAAQQGAFRSVVDLIAVDVQVVDANGTPIEQLGPAAFDVSIEGKRHKVVSVDFLRQARAAPVPDPRAAGTDRPRDDGTGRTFLIAVDNGSFDVGTARPTMEAVRRFVDRLTPADRVGLYVYPSEAWISPSLERAALRAALTSIIGERQTIRSHYNLRPAEVVDITAQSTSPNSFLTVGRGRGSSMDPATAMVFDPVLAVQRRECPEEQDCPSRIYNEGMAIAAQLETQAQVSIDGLDMALRRLAEIAGRKAVVLVSAGLLVSDRLDGRPQAPAIARGMAQAAARANASVYTIQIDAPTVTTSASSRGMGSTDLSRDRAMLGNWLDNFSIEAGGQRIYVPQGAGEFAFDRVLRETSAHYLLGVAPEDADRDGLAHRLRVKVDRRGATVRSRQWVVIPSARKYIPGNR